MALIFESEIKLHSVIENLDPSGLPEGEPEINISTVTGFLKDDGEKLSLSYAEAGEGGKVFTDLDIFTDGGVRLSRHGALESELHFREGEEYNTVYSVPPYEFDIKIITKRIRSTVQRHGGTLQLLYSMNVGGQEKSVRMKIEVSVRK